MNRTHIMCLSGLLVLSGCTTWSTNNRNELARTGPSTQFESKKTEEYAAAQSAVYAHLKTMTGEKEPNQDQIITAGLQYADVLCSDYIESLYWVNKQLKADIRDVNAFGTLTTGVMGIAKSAASTIAGAAVVFGYAEESMNTMGSRVLFELEPSSIRALVESSQKSFRTALQTGYTNRAGAFTVIREYISLCLPSRIEAEINNAAKRALPFVSEGDPKKGESPKVSLNPSQVNTEYHTYSSDINSMLLKTYVYPNGQQDNAAHELLSKWMKLNEINVPIGIFLISDKYKNQWKNAVEHFNLK